MGKSWVNSAERIGADLHLELTGPGGRRAALIGALREAVRSGRLAPGTRLPPYRSLAADLGVARNTVADAYGNPISDVQVVVNASAGSATPVRVMTDPHGHAITRWTLGSLAGDQNLTAAVRGTKVRTTVAVHATKGSAKK